MKEFILKKIITFDDDNYGCLEYTLDCVLSSSVHYYDYETTGSWNSPFEENNTGWLIFRNFSNTQEFKTVIKEIKNFLKQLK